MENYFPSFSFHKYSKKSMGSTKVGAESFYVLQSLFFSFTLHWGQRPERGLSERLWLAYIGYCVQFLHQCQLSKSLPLMYSTIRTISNKYYVTTDIFQCRPLANLAKINWIPFFYFTNIPRSTNNPCLFSRR